MTIEWTDTAPNRAARLYIAELLSAIAKLQHEGLSLMELTRGFIDSRESMISMEESYAQNDLLAREDGLPTATLPPADRDRACLDVRWN